MLQTEVVLSLPRINQFPKQLPPRAVLALEKAGEGRNKHCNAGPIKIGPSSHFSTTLK